MKETKVYVDELPEDCKDCPCCSCELKPEFIKIGDFMYCNLLKQKFRYKEERKKLKDCPLIDIKPHDRELVKEVCEKIREKIVYYPVSVLDEAGKVKANTWGMSKKDIENLINQLQKEIKK